MAVWVWLSFRTGDTQGFRLGFQQDQGAVLGPMFEPQLISHKQRTQMCEELVSRDI